MKPKTSVILSELKEHIPFTLTATLIAVILIIFLRKTDMESLFHILHPLHLFVSAIVSSAIYYKYKKGFISALLIGVISSIVIGSLSDILLPYLGGQIFQLKTSFHLPLIEEPLIILSAAFVGSVLGIATKLTKLPHFIHVFLSIFASLFYLLAFSSSISLLYFIAVFLIVFIAVLIPCCISDIIFPLLFVRRRH
ncbi:MAG: hypothetical protein ABIB79_02595 [archaeon]